MAFMILVNTPGDGRHVYWPLEHAEWHGWTPTDVVFPSFLWIVGLAMTLSLGRKLARGDSRAVLFGSAARRAAILFVLGVLVYVYPQFDLHTERILGVLQRIAICYFAAAAIFLTTKVRGQIVWIVSLMAVYWLLMAFAPVPGYGAGRLDVEGNFAHYIDRVVLGPHNYIWTKTWDPEGIVSTLPAIATCLLGIIAGHIVALRRSLGERCVRLFGLGAILAAHQQKALDRFVHPLHGRSGFRDVRRLPVAGRQPRLAARGQAAGDHGLQRHRHLPGERIPGRSSRLGPLGRPRRQSVASRLDLQPHLRRPGRTLQRLINLRHRLRSGAVSLRLVPIPPWMVRARLDGGKHYWPPMNTDEHR
jgi:hypothetical protein